MVIGLLKETGEDKRVALTPENVAAILKLNVERVVVEKGAGEGAFISDKDFEAKGAQICGRGDVISTADVIVTVLAPSKEDIIAMGKGKVLIGGLNPLKNVGAVQQMVTEQVSSFSLDMIPRTSRAQAMDILSSMATITGYKAVIIAASHLPTFFPMFMTAAGTIAPAKVVVLGAGVAGLQAIATARRLGAMVEASDVRAAAKEEVLSLGAKFIEVEGARDDKDAGGYAVEQTAEFRKKQNAKVQEHIVKADVVICSAQVMGRKAPVLILKETVAKMKPGSVIVDLAVNNGGNCEGSVEGKTVVLNGVTIIGNSELPASMPMDASKMLGKNMINFLKLIINAKDGELRLNFEDDLVEGTCITHHGAIKNQRVLEAIGA